MRIIMLCLLLCVGCSSLSNEVSKISIETNTAIMQKYEQVSSLFRMLIMDLISQLESQGKDPGGLPEWLADLDRHDADVSKIAMAYTAMIRSGIIEPTPWIKESLEIADELIHLKEKYNDS